MPEELVFRIRVESVSKQEEFTMAQTSPRQRKTVGRVMHEYRHGELRGGTGGKVKNPRQAIAIALKEAGASKYESKSENERNFRRTKGKEARGETWQQETEGKSHVGARGRLESSLAIGGNNATATVRPGRKAGRGANPTKSQLYRRARAKGIAGRSKMSKRQLASALHDA
jgi:hypothetical protein